MWMWEFKKDGITIKREIYDEILGKKEIEETITYEDLKKLKNLEIVIKGIDPVIEKGTLKAIKMYVVSYRRIDRDVDEGFTQELAERETKKQPQYIITYRKQINREGTLPNMIRKIIKERGTISDRELREELRKRGYKGTGGSIGATIKVLLLDKCIEISKRGDEKYYRWIGD